MELNVCQYLLKQICPISKISLEICKHCDRDLLESKIDKLNSMEKAVKDLFDSIPKKCD